MITFTNETMQEILPFVQKILLTQEIIFFKVLNPDLSDGYAGSIIIIDEQHYMHRSYKSWMDLAELLHCKMLTVKESGYPFVTMGFKKLSTDSFHAEQKDTEKYGTNSKFNQIHKMEEPAFFYYYNQALDNVKVENKTHILNLGINTGDEFTIIKNKLDTNKYESMNLIGIDHSTTAIEYANNVFEEDNVTFYTSDINDIDSLKLGKFDLLISIGTLQSPSINFKLFLMFLVQNYLEKDAAIILGFPNSRWVGGEMIYGARAPNYAMSEQSLLYNDVMFAKKYLQQKKFRVTLTGKQYVFLTATKIG